MKKIIIFIAILMNILYSNSVFSADVQSWWGYNIQTWVSSESNGIKFDILDDIQNDDDIRVWNRWEKSILELMHNIAKDFKTVIYIITWIYFFILVIKLLLSSNTEEEVSNFKKWIMWITIWILVMQISFYMVEILYDRDINWSLALSFVDYILKPLIKVLETAAAFFFMFMAIFSFYTLITSNWNEEKAETGKKTIVYSILWFIVIKLSSLIVESTYWKLDCENPKTLLWKVFNIQWSSCEAQKDLSKVTEIVVDVINWINSFIWIAMILLIIYTWVKVLFSMWDEEKLSSAKKAILYIFIWALILVTNYLILTFFILPENTI